MQSKKPELDIPHLFWSNYVKADMLEKDKLLNPIIKNFLSMSEIKDQKVLSHVLKVSLQGYFDDLIEYFYSKK